jgi:hypothetical protein
MKMKTIGGVCMMMLSISSVYAFTGYGACNLGKETFDSLTCYGSTELNGTIIKGNVKVTGPFKTKNATMGDMTIIGTANLENSIVEGSSDVTGLLHAQDVKFQKGIRITAANMVLTHSSVAGSITMSSDEQTPYLKVECGSEVTGTIQFNGQPGIVQRTEDTKLSNNKIENGKEEIIHKKCVVN